MNEQHCIGKKNEKLRICLDLNDLNKALKDVKFPSKTIEEVLPELAEAKNFSKVFLTGK